MNTVYVLIFFFIIAPATVHSTTPLYCQSSDFISCDKYSVIHADYKQRSSISIHTPQQFQKQLTLHALTNIIEHKHHLLSMYPELNYLSEDSSKNCSLLFKSMPSLNRISAAFHDSRSSLNTKQRSIKRKNFEQKTIADFKSIEFMWERIQTVKDDIRILNAKLLLLKNKRKQIVKTRLLFGNKTEILDELDHQLKFITFSLMKNQQQLKMAQTVVSINPLLVTFTPINVRQSLNGLAPSSLYKSLKQSKKGFTDEVTTQLLSLNKGMEKICSTKGEYLHHQQPLVQDLFFQYFRRDKKVNMQPTSTINALQNIHCKLIEQKPLLKDKHLYYTLGAAGMLLTGVALAPFTAGTSLSAAIIIGGSSSLAILGGLETQAAWNHYITSDSLASANVGSKEDVAQDYLSFRNHAILTTTDMALVPLDAYSLYYKSFIKIQHVVKVSRPTVRHFVKNIHDFTIHTQLHIKRVERIGLYLFKKFPNEFKQLDQKIVHNFLKKHDQGKVNVSLWKDKGKKPIIDKIYKYYNVPKESISPKELALLGKAVDDLNAMDTMVAYQFFRDNKLYTATGEISPKAHQLLRLEKLADIIDRGKNMVSPEEFAKKAMIPASKWFKNHKEQLMAMSTEHDYNKIIAGLDYNQQLPINP